jgi:hypothetical protein
MGKTFSEIYNIIVILSKHKYTGGLQHWKTDILLWKMKNTVDGHPQADGIKMLKGFQNEFIMTRSLTIYNLSK